MNNLVLVMKDFEVTQKEVTSTDTARVLYIKGYANRYLDSNGSVVVDRSGDSILPTGYDLTNFMKNPILLAYHDKKLPAGKIVDIKVSMDGLEITAEVHEVLNEKVFYAVDNNILKTFSVGFKPLDTYYDAITDIYYYRAVELLEVSIVSVPDNQDSIFTTLTQSPCASGLCMLASKATDEHTIKTMSTIKNKEVSDSRWNEVDKTTLSQDILDSGIPEAIKEAYLVVGDIEKRATWKFPHHEFKGGKLTVSKEGVISAFSALKSIKDEDKYSKEDKLDAAEHLLKHYKDITESGLADEVPEELLSLILELKSEPEAVEEKSDDNSNEKNEDDNGGDDSNPKTQDAEGSAQTAEGDSKESDTVSFEQVLSFVTASESPEAVTQLLQLYSVVENRVNTLLN